MKLGYWFIVLVALLVVTLLPSSLLARHYSFADSNAYKAVKPKFSPPNIVFGIVWPVLYVLMSVSVWFALRHTFDATPQAQQVAQPPQAQQTQQQGLGISIVVIFAASLALNFAWVPVFYKKDYMGSLGILLGLLCVSLVLWVLLLKVNIIAGALWAPYLVWLVFALQLNVSVVIQSKSNDELKKQAYAFLDREGSNLQAKLKTVLQSI